MPTLVIDIDSLRPDHLGCYGYDQPTSPTIDGLAADGVRFENAYAAGSPCMPSRAGVLTGRYPITNGVITHGPQGEQLTPADGADPTLPEVFFEDHRPAIAISSFPRHPAPWFYHLWTTFHHPREPDGFTEFFQDVRGATVADRTIETLEAHDGEDWFVYAQFWDPHGPYRRSDEEVAPFRDPPMPRHPTDEQIAEHRSWGTIWRGAAAPGLSREALQYVDADDIEDRAALAEVLAHYDAEIRYVDRQVGRILERLRALDRYEQTTIVLIADHGEEFGEHGVYREHWSTHEGTQRIPMVIKPGGDTPVSPGGREQLVTNVDLAPTIAGLAGLSPGEAWQGQSLEPLLADVDADWRDHVVMDHGLYCAQRAVRTDRWKFVRTYHPGLWEVPDRQLFDLDADPQEQHDRLEDDPAIADELEGRMAQWVEDHVGPHEDALHAVAREGPGGLEYARMGGSQ